ncbi:HAD family hydrolase [Actinopolymorpha sp. B9G3]|uniref:HAD family hydrolase n=1 Tax=Actinopolymorpha sp. B9G3 TaxID=3158970 RepID=UPI0032D91C0F
MGHSAVIFDFFGTLTESVTAAERRTGHAEVAAALGVPADDYAEALHRSWPDRARGRHGDLPSTMRWLAAACGVEVDDTSCAAACAVRRRTQRDYVRLRPDAEPVLRTLRERGIAVGLVSDCTLELPEVWNELPIADHVDAPVFSVQIGVKKPDPAIYLRACERLGVEPTDCVYVGDGDSNELVGAATVGMRPRRLLMPDHADAHVFDPVTWTGDTIASLTAVLDS